MAGSVITMVAWAGVAHSSGSGWVQAVGALLGAFLAGRVSSPRSSRPRRARVALHGLAGRRPGRAPARAHLRGRPARTHPPRWPVGPDRQAGGGQRGDQDGVAHRAPPAGGASLDAVVVEVASSAPFGLLWWARDVELPLPRLLHVAPRIGDADRPLATVEDAHGEAPVRGSRPGWASPGASAPTPPATPDVPCTGRPPPTSVTLMVRESERQTDDPVTVELVLPDDPAAAEVGGRADDGRGRRLPRPSAARGARSPTRRPAGWWARSPTGSTSVGAWPGRCRHDALAAVRRGQPTRTPGAFDLVPHRLGTGRAGRDRRLLVGGRAQSRRSPCSPWRPPSSATSSPTAGGPARGPG